jgi:hypothetical protein
MKKYFNDCYIYVLSPNRFKMNEHLFTLQISLYERALEIVSAEFPNDPLTIELFPQPNGLIKYVPVLEDLIERENVSNKFHEHLRELFYFNINPNNFN